MSQLHGAAKVTNDSINTSSNSERAKREENGLKVKLVVIWFIWLDTFLTSLQKMSLWDHHKALKMWVTRENLILCHF